jgi:hypothetical protein
MNITFEAEITPDGRIQIPEKYRYLVNGYVSVTIADSKKKAQQNNRKEEIMKFAGAWSDFTDSDLAEMFPRAFRCTKNGSTVDEKESS